MKETRQTYLFATFDLIATAYVDTVQVIYGETGTFIHNTGKPEGLA